MGQMQGADPDFVGTEAYTTFGASFSCTHQQIHFINLI
jgi:hypothetical protein